MVRATDDRPSAALAYGDGRRLFIVGMTVLLLAISLIFGLHGQAPSYDIVPDPWQGPVF